eukprot:3689316-Rhodomonas_salina.1
MSTYYYDPTDKKSIPGNVVLVRRKSSPRSTDVPRLFATFRCDPPQFSAYIPPPESPAKNPSSSSSSSLFLAVLDPNQSMRSAVLLQRSLHFPPLLLLSLSCVLFFLSAHAFYAPSPFVLPSASLRQHPKSHATGGLMLRGRAGRLQLRGSRAAFTQMNAAKTDDDRGEESEEG